MIDGVKPSFGNGHPAQPVMLRTHALILGGASTEAEPRLARIADRIEASAELRERIRRGAIYNFRLALQSFRDSARRAAVGRGELAERRSYRPLGTQCRKICISDLFRATIERQRGAGGPASADDHILSQPHCAPDCGG